MNTQLSVIWEPKIIAIINEIEKKEVNMFINVIRPTKYTYKTSFY